MYLYTFNDQYYKFDVSVLPTASKMYSTFLKFKNNECAPFENFGDCLLCNDDLPLDMAHSIWESRVK